MGQGTFLRQEFFVLLGRAAFQLFHQTTPFEIDLAARDFQSRRSAQAAYLVFVEPVTALKRFRVHGSQVFGDEGGGPAVCFGTARVGDDCGSPSSRPPEQTGRAVLLSTGRRGP